MKCTIALLILGASLVCGAPFKASAENTEDFSMLEGIVAEALSFREMAEVEGKIHTDAFALVNRPSSFIFSETSSSAIMSFLLGSGSPLVFPDLTSLLTTLPILPKPQETIAFLAPLGLGNLSLASGKDLFALLGLFQ